MHVHNLGISFIWEAELALEMDTALRVQALSPGSSSESLVTPTMSAFWSTSLAARHDRNVHRQSVAVKKKSGHSCPCMELVGDCVRV